MNKKIWALAVLALGFTACEDEGEPEEYTIVNPFLGKWNVIQEGTLVNGTINYQDVVVDEGCQADYVVIDETTFELHDFEGDGMGSCTDNDDLAAYYVENGYIFLDNGVDTSTLDVISIDQSTMQLVFTDEDSGELVFTKFQREVEEEEEE